ncbi:MAG: shikimate dehydrogenase [Clostridiales bacterium]|nr:shikimate dehydrogenase [Clostridiales bacterium]
MLENTYAVIGHPIAHTMSPFIHARLFSFNSIRAEYGVLDIPPQDLAERMDTLRSLRGFNITIPHKQAIIPLLDGLDSKSVFYHSVNTVQNRNGRLTGFTTDGTGFCKALEAGGARLDGRTVILGAGGAGRVMAFEAALCGGTVTIAVRPHGIEAARQLCADIQSKVKNAKADFCLLDEIREKMDLLANATPVGMYPNTEACPVSEEIIRNAACVFDAVYNPNETLLLRTARKNGVRTIGGISMLVWQAAAAQESWYGAKFRKEDIETLCADAVFEMKKTFGNLVLCGFMGSGKTTVGNLLAQKCGRTFVDMDQYIEQKQGVRISELFASKGEAAFRKLEREAAKELGLKSGLVIATGGGTLMDPENTEELKRNGVVLFLDASLNRIRERLAGDQSRPLLSGPEPEEKMRRLYRERFERYHAAADIKIPADAPAGEVAEQILRLLKNPLTPSE